MDLLVDIGVIMLLCCVVGDAVKQYVRRCGE